MYHLVIKYQITNKTTRFKATAFWECWCSHYKEQSQRWIKRRWKSRC